MESNKAAVLLQPFNHTIDQWISCLDNYTLEMLHQQPQPGSWSLGQVYMHIIADTGFYVSQIKASLESNSNSEKEMLSAARQMLNNNSFPDMILVGPSVGDSVPQPLSKDGILQSLIKIRNEVNQLAVAFDLSAANGKTEHPGFRFFNALEWLQFAEIHMRHHFRQKTRIDEKLFSSR